MSHLSRNEVVHEVFLFVFLILCIRFVLDIISMNVISILPIIQFHSSNIDTEDV